MDVSEGSAALHDQGGLLSSMMEAADPSAVSEPDCVASQTNLHFESLTVAWYKLATCTVYFPSCCFG
jgi:hypothetical protein